MKHIYLGYIPECADHAYGDKHGHRSYGLRRPLYVGTIPEKIDRLPRTNILIGEVYDIITKLGFFPKNHYQAVEIFKSVFSPLGFAVRSKPINKGRFKFLRYDHVTIFCSRTILNFTKLQIFALAKAK